MPEIIHIHIKLDPGLHKQFRVAVVSAGTTMQEVIKKFIEAYIKRDVEIKG